tara:strand:+ start:1611 stop:2510 length:900 start_codon:yes stop_codon:yes gene_type:complete
MSDKIRNIEFKKGFDLKPDKVSSLGTVTFTNGTLTDLSADQRTCEAYGYRYNVSTGTCSAFTFRPKLEKTLFARNKHILGVNNSIEPFSQNNIVVGTANTNKSYNCNTLTLGAEHEITHNIKNSAIIGGKRAKVTRQSEVAQGGGQRAISDSTDAVTFNSRRQTSTVELSCVTIDNTATNMTIQGDGESFINVQNNSIIGYDIYITRLELGGTSGTAGNYSYRNIRGAVKINQTGVMSFVVGFSRNIAKVGVNGTCIMANSTTGGVPSISVNVQDRNNVHNLWSASVTLHEVISETNIV